MLYVPKAQSSCLPRSSTYLTSAVRVPVSGVPYVPRTVAPQVAHLKPGKPLLPMRRAVRQGEPSGGLAGRRLHILRARPKALEPARLLLFMTTAGSSVHLKFFQGCWPALLNASSALRDATVLVHLVSLPACNARVPTAWHSAATLLPNPEVHMYGDDNPGYQEGAMLAMRRAVEHRWFQGHEWVIRLGPDTLLLQSARLDELLAMPRVLAIFANCPTKRDPWRCPKGRRAVTAGNLPTNPLLHTDFMAFRPSALARHAATAYATPSNCTASGCAAEYDASEQLQGLVPHAAWLCTEEVFSICRLDSAEVVHTHSHVCLTDPGWRPREGG